MTAKTHTQPTSADPFSLVAILIAKYGLGILGFIAVVPVYLDLKSSNERFAILVESNIKTNAALVERIEKAHEKVGLMNDTIRRIETGITNLQTRNP
jgi:predicted nuclease with TOPRIM domain